MRETEAGWHLGNHGEVVDHVGVDDGVDDGLAHVPPARVVHVGQNVRVWLVGQQGVQQAHVPVLQHAVVVVQPRILVPRVYQERVVQACMCPVSANLGSCIHFDSQ